MSLTIVLRRRPRCNLVCNNVQEDREKLTRIRAKFGHSTEGPGQRGLHCLVATTVAIERTVKPGRKPRLRDRNGKLLASRNWAPSRRPTCTLPAQLTLP